MTRRRRLRRLALPVALAGLALLGAGLFPQEPLRRLIENRLRAALGPDLRLRRLHVVPALLRADFEGLELRSAQLDASIPRGRLQLSLGTLLGRERVVEALEIEAPRLVLRPAGGGTSTTTPAALFVLRRVAVRDAQVCVETGAGRAELTGLEVTGALGGGRLELQARGGAWRPSEGRPLELRAAHASLSTDAALEARLDTLELQTAGSRLRAQGALGRLGAPRLAVDVDGRLVLAEIEGLAGAEGLAGTVDLLGRVQGPVSALENRWILTGRDLRLATWPVDELKLELTRPGHATAWNAEARAHLLGGELGLTGTTDGRSVDAQLSARALDSERLRRQLALGSVALPGRLTLSLGLRGPLGGHMDAKLHATAQVVAAGQSLHLEAEGAGRVSRVAGPDLAVTVQAARTASLPTDRLAGLNVTAQGRWRGSSVEAALGGELRLRSGAGTEPIDLPLSGNVAVTGSNWSASLEALPPAGRVAATARAQAATFETLAVEARDVPAGIFAGNLHGRVDLHFQGVGPAARLDGQLTAQARDLGIGAARIGAVSLSGPVRQGRADLDVGAGDLALTGELQLDAQQVRGQLDSSGLPLERVSREGLAGKVAARLDFAVPLAHPDRAQAHVQVRSLALAREAWSLASREPFAARLDAGQVTLERARLAGTGLELAVQGQVDLKDGGLQGDVDVAAQLSELALPAGIERHGRVTGQVRLAGTLERPETAGTLAWQGVLLDGAATAKLSLADGSLVLAGRALEIAGIEAQWAGGELRLAGRLPFAALLPAWRRDPRVVATDEGASLTLAWRGLDTEQLRTPRAAGSDDDPAAAEVPKGRLEGRLAVEGGLASWSEARAQLVAPVTELSLPGGSARFSALELRLEGGIVRGEPIRLTTANGLLVLAGEADLARRRADLALTGQLELRALSALMSEAALTGHAVVDVRAQGPFDGLHPRGSVLVRDASLRLRLLPQAITALQADIALDEDGWLRLPNGSGQLGGGTLLLGGNARIVGTRVEDVAFALSAREALLSYPPGLRSRVDADLTLTGRGGALLLAGKVEAGRGRYDLDQALDRSLFARAARTGPSPTLRGVALRLDLLVDQPLRVVSQRYAFDQVTARGSLGLRGDLESPLPFGRLELARDGVLSLRDQRLRLQHGLLLYDGTWDAALDLEARAQLTGLSAEALEACGLSAGQGVDVTVEVKGTLGLSELTATAPGLPDARALLLTRSCAADLAAVGSETVRSQADLFLGDHLSRGLREQLLQLGLDEVTIQPQLLARDTDPGARFTFGKRLAPAARVIYSTALNLPESQWVKLDLGPWHTLAGTLKRAGAGDWTATAGQRLEWGGGVAAPARRGGGRARTLLEAVVLEGSLPYPEKRLLGVLGLKLGQRTGSWSLLERTDALRAWLQEQGHLEAEVGGRLDGGTAHVQIQAGPRYSWRVDGARQPADFTRLMRSALYADEALELGRERLERDLRRAGHLQARVRTRVEPDGELRVLTFEADPGPRAELVAVELRGARALGQKALLRLAGGAGAVAADLSQARRTWLQAYRERHRLGARIEGPRLVPVAGGLRLEATIDEGPAARVARVEYPGTSLERGRLDEVARLRPGDLVEDQALAGAALRLRELYQGLGYPSVRVTLASEPVATDLALRFAVDEGRQVALREVQVEGLVHTRRSVVLDRAHLHPGQPLDPRAVLAAENRVQALGSFASVTSETLTDQGVVRLVLREAPRFLARYELSWEESRGLGGQLDGEVRHLLGRGLALGGRYARFSDIEDARAFASLPVRHGLLLVSGARLEERLPTLLGTNTRLERELRLQQTLEPARWWKVLAGYRFKRVTVEPVFPLPIDVASFEPALVRDSRSNPLDPRSGRFYSLGLTLAESWLGSDFRFAKGLGQVNVYSTHGAFTWAQGYRLGLGWGLGGQRIRSTERFKAGGAGSLRGVGNDELGPRDVFGEPSGGEAVLLFNQELRYRHPSGLGAVVFYDAGNVFDRASELSLGLRHAVGAGLRYASPVGLLRVDLGLPLFRREGEKRYQVFFSLGQAF